MTNEERAQRILNYLGSDDDDPGIPFICSHLRDVRAEEREAIAKWFEAKSVEESGPDWGLSSDDERADIRDHNDRINRYAAAIRARP